MCKHNFIKFGQVSVCKLCGLTLFSDGKVMFDKQFTNYGKKKRRKTNAKKGK